MQITETGFAGWAGLTPEEAECGNNAPAALRGKRACLLAFSRIGDDPRVRRQGDALHRAGWEVTAVGLPDSLSPPPPWRVLTINKDVTNETATPISLLSRWRESQRQFQRKAGTLLRHQWVRLDENYGGRLYDSIEGVAAMRTAISPLRADIWLANDWTTLPLAVEAAAASGGIVGYDTHELAVAECEQSVRWRLMWQPLIRAIERRYIREARVISAVSPGIGEFLMQLYGLPSRPLTIRNVPEYREIAFRPCGATIEVLYHGLVAPGRGLEEVVDSIAAWRPEFHLTIRGPGNADSLVALASRVRRAGAEDRVRIEPPVPMTELVDRAVAFDVGLFALPAHSRHNRLALPNKLFEYIMAGLALCVSDLPEMARVVKQHGLGTCLASIEPAAIAAAVNSLTRSTIDVCKQHSLEAARELCWARESIPMLAAYDTALDATRH
jgi:glycosyltransferase involved in cell wall biosynthesis